MRTLVAALTALLIAPASASAALKIDVVSNRADLISAGDALVAIDCRGVDPADIRVTEDGRDVTGAFAVRPDGRFEGLVTGLDVGANELVATDGADTARITIANHPNGGPVFSGPQIQPWVCTNGSPDPQCNQPATYRYEYKSSLDGQLHEYDPDQPAERRRGDHDPDRRDRPLHHPRRDGLPGPRPVPDRDALPARPSRGSRGRRSRSSTTSC